MPTDCDPTFIYALMHLSVGGGIAVAAIAAAAGFAAWAFFKMLGDGWG